MTKYFGPTTSGYLDPTNRAWETVVYEAGKPVLDVELNLEQDIDGGQAEAGLRIMMPSGWIADDFTGSSSPTVGIFSGPTAGTLSGTFNVSASSSVTASVSQTGFLFAGDIITFASQAGVYYKLLTVSGTALTLTSAYTGTPAGATTATFEVPNAIQIPNNLTAHVNGWAINIANTNVANAPPAVGLNQITLPAPPSGAGVLRTDVVILEVWRLLLSAAPSTVGKSPAARIWQYGNVKIDPARDSSLNYADDIENSNVGSETTKRVQIQYRLRVVSGINVFAYPYAMDDPSMLANTVPASPTAPDGTVTSFAYANAGGSGDPGLWVAGDGNPANSLGTVDGYMYAIPLMAVFRRNSTAFNRLTNQNGGQLSPAASDRPDGLLTDIIAARDVVDMRLGVSPVGWNYPEVLDKNLTYLLDNALTTDWMTTSYAGGMNGPTVLWGDEIGETSDGTGPLIGAFDAVRRTFSDRPICEVITVAVAEPGGGWANSTITVDFTSLAVYPYTAFNWAASAGNAIAVDVQGGFFIGGTGFKTINAKDHIHQVTNLGVSPIGSLTITFDAMTGTGISSETLYLDILVCYPAGTGLTKTPTNSYGSTSFQVVTAISGSAPYNFSSLTNLSIDNVHREAQIQYLTSALTLTQAALTGTGSAATISAFATPLVTITGLTGMGPGIVGQYLHFSGAANGGNNGTFQIAAYVSATSVKVTNASGVFPDANSGAITWSVVAASFRIPERASGVPTGVLKNGVAIAGTVTMDAPGRVATFTNSADWTTSGDHLTYTYVGLRPAPSSLVTSTEIIVWYETRAPQTGRDSIIGSSITVIPRYIAPYLYTLTQGPASEDVGYPFPTAYVQTGGIYNTSAGPYTGEGTFNSRSEISISDFNATTGMLRLPVYVPFTPDPEAVTFNRATSADIDAEGRTFFKSVPSGYIPNAYAQPLSNPVKHKVFQPMIAEMPLASNYGHKGQLVLILLIRWAVFDEVNGVYFVNDLTQNTTTASVFRIKGNLLSKRNT